MMTKSGIRVDSYVMGKDGELINFDDLTPEQRVKASTELKEKLLNSLFAGKATFSKEYEGDPDAYYV